MMRIGKKFEKIQEECVEVYRGRPWLLDAYKKSIQIGYTDSIIALYVDTPKDPVDFPSIPKTPEMTDEVWKFVVHILKKEKDRNSFVYADSIARWTGIPEEIAQAIFAFVNEFDAENVLDFAVSDCVYEEKYSNELPVEQSTEQIFFYNAMVKLYWRKYIHCLYTGEPFPYGEILGDCPEKFTKCDFVAKAEQLAEDEEEFRDILGYSVGKILAEVGDAMGKGVPENVMRCMLPFGPNLAKEIIALSGRRKEE